MAESSSIEPGFRRICLRKTCAYCGAGFEVHLLLDAQPESHRYGCPDCGKPHEIKSAMEPELRMVHQRTDGKRDRYQDTMF